MKTENYIFNIDNPCSENWDKMTSNDAGKFCNQCAKNVIDFSSLSDSQIIKIIQKYSENVCGRMRSDQLNREMFPINEKPSRSFFYQFLASAFLFFTSIKLQANFLKENLKNKTEVSSDFNFSSKILEENPATEDTNRKYIFKGNIIDEKTKEPLSFVIVSAYSDKYITNVKTNLDGEFSLSIPDSIFKTDSIKFTFKITNYESKTINLKKSKINQPILIVLIEEVHFEPIRLIQGLMPIQRKYESIVVKKKWWQRIFSK